MAYLVEYRDLEGTPQTTTTTVEQRPPQERSKSSGTLKIVSAFRRGSIPASSSSPPPLSRQTSAAEPERKSSLTTVPSRLRRKKTQKIDGSSKEAEHAASRLGELFFGLPSEILTLIISYLDVQDLYHLRQASRATPTILKHNASTVTRLMLPKIIPEECLYHVNALYPIPSPCYSIAHLLQTSHRQKTIHKTIYHTLSFIQMRIYMLTPQTPAGASHFHLNRQKLITTLQKPAWTIYHFLESTRHLLTITHDTEHDPIVGKFWSCHLCKAALHKLVDSYPTQDLLGAYHFYQLLLTHLRAATRAPTYAGTIERKLRGWGKSPASDEDLAILIVLGGMEILSKISMMQGSYDTRLKTVSTFVEKIKYHADVNTNLRGPYSFPQKVNKLEGNDDEETTDLTISLSPPYNEIKQDHLDHIPGLNEFFFPVWEERILKEGLVESENDIEGPFGWVQKIVYEEERSEDGNEGPVGNNGNSSNNHGAGSGGGNGNGHENGNGNMGPSSPPGGQSGIYFGAPPV